MKKIFDSLIETFLSVVGKNYVYRELKKYLTGEYVELKIILVHLVFQHWKEEKTARFLSLERKFYRDFGPFIPEMKSRIRYQSDKNVRNKK